MRNLILVISLFLLGCASEQPFLSKKQKVIKPGKKQVAKKIYFQKTDEICAIGYGNAKDKKTARKIAILRAKAEISRILKINIDNEIDSEISSNGKKSFQTSSHQDSLSYLKNLKIKKETFKNGVYRVKICKEN